MNRGKQNKTMRKTETQNGLKSSIVLKLEIWYFLHDIRFNRKLNGAIEKSDKLAYRMDCCTNGWHFLC